MKQKEVKFFKCKYKSLIFLLLFFIGCSTQKDAVLNKWYHQLNTKYNGLFYAQEHLKTGIKKITESHKDNYKDIIPINQYGTLETLLERANEIKQNKRRETIVKNKEKAIISKRLVTLKKDVPILLDVQNGQVFVKLEPSASLPRSKKVVPRNPGEINSTFTLGKL